MIQLKILNPDGSLYWREHFNDEESALKWLEEEKTRKYWNEKFTHSLVFLGPTPEEIEQRKQSISAAKEARNLIRRTIKDGKGKAKTVAQAAALLDLIIDLLEQINALNEEP